MKDGFIRVAADGVAVTVADPDACAAAIKARIDAADAAGVNLLVLPELCLCGVTCGDLLYAEALLCRCRELLCELAAYTAGTYPVTVIGLPLLWEGRLYNCAAVLADGRVLGIVPGSAGRQCADGTGVSGTYTLPDGTVVPFGTDLCFAHSALADYTFGVAVGDTEPAVNAALIANPTAVPASVGAAERRRAALSALSVQRLCGYVSASAGPEESTGDKVYSRHQLVAELGRVLAENPPFGNTAAVTEVDVSRLAYERRRADRVTPAGAARMVPFAQEVREHTLTRTIDQNPFLPAGCDAAARAETMLSIQAHGLARRLSHTHAKAAVIGVSGGLDSTLALLAAARAMDILGRPRTDILAVTMPCFGTTARTRSNAELLCEQLGATLKTVNIAAAVTQHFADIGQDPHCYDVTFENAQARERTQVLMDLANQVNGLVVGTGDLSELALGWATYNGDHMSMYGVNAGVPKTLVRHLVKHEADRAPEALRAVLYDVLDTPVSPELLPADDKGEIAQKTEDLVGPNPLHDFFLYHTVRYGTHPQKLLRLALVAFDGVYGEATVRYWLRTFLRRFFNQQFKRSCLPDGPKMGSVSLSPRGDWQMPSDATARLWLAAIDEI